RHCPQVGAVLLELCCQPVVLIHRSHPLVASRRTSDELNRADVTLRFSEDHPSRSEESKSASTRQNPGTTPSGCPESARTGPGRLGGHGRRSNRDSVSG